MDYVFNSDGTLASITYPRYLFKYCSITDYLYSSIAEKYLWFSSITDFNDPFDCSSVIDQNVSEDEIRLYLGFGFDQLFRKAKSPELKRKLEAALDTAVEMISRDKEKFFEGMMTDMFKRSTEQKGICCFSAEKRSTLMWAHYADSFRGVCLVYDFYELANNAPFIPLKVQYLAQIPKFNYIRHRLQDTSASDPHNVLTSNTEFDQMMFGMKTLDWAYEREYRLVSFTQGKNSINPTSLKGIIFGSRTTSDQKEKLEALLAQYSVDIETSTLVLNPRSKEVEITAFENEMITRKDVRLRNLYQTTRANI